MIEKAAPAAEPKAPVKSEAVASIYKILEICRSLVVNSRDDDLEDIDRQLLNWASREFSLRAARSKIFSRHEVIGEPCWDILLDLTVARIKQSQISVSSCCVASGIAPTTALRWIAHLQAQGLVDRTHDPKDKRRIFLSLSDAGMELMRRYYIEIVASQPALA